MNRKNEASFFFRQLEELYRAVFRKRPTTLIKGEEWFQSCQIVFGYLGIDLDPTLREAQTLESLAEAYDVAYRTVRLREKWWEEDHGPLLGFRLETNTPLVLVVKGKEYVAIDPNTNEERRVADSFETIGSTAIMFYLPTGGDMSSLRTLWHTLFIQNGKLYLFFTLVGILGVLVGFMLPVANQLLFDYIIPLSKWEVYTQLLIGLVVVAVSTFSFSLLRAYAVLKLNAIVTNRLQMGLWNRIFRLPMDFFRKFAKGDLLQRTLVFQEIQDTLSQQSLTIIFNGVFSFFYLIAMFVYSKVLSLVGLAIILLYSLVSIAVILVRIRYEKKFLASEGRMQGFLVQAIRMFPKLRVSSSEKRIYEKWSQEFAFNQSVNYKAMNLETILSTASFTLPTFFTFSLFTAYIFWMKESLSVGSFLAFSAAFSPFSIAFLGLVEAVSGFAELIPYIARVKPILSTPLITDQGKSDPGVISGEITVNQLSFRYSDHTPYVLNDLYLEINPGQFIGLVGPSGCGKSTLCRLLFGMETAQKGSVSYGEYDLKGIAMRKFSMQVVFALQEGGIFAGSIFENITCGNRYEPDVIKNALRDSTLGEDLSSFPMGLDTFLTSGTGILSGGQKQKVLLARCLVKEPRVLILDEALNSMDNTTRERILDQLLARKMTLIVSAHNLATFKRADQIFVFEQQRLVASGTLEQLREHPGLFQRYYKSQMRLLG